MIDNGPIVEETEPISIVNGLSVTETGPTVNHIQQITLKR